MSIYGVAADAIIHCYAIDDEVHEDGAKYAPAHLRKLVDKHARIPLLMNDDEAAVN